MSDIRNQLIKDSYNYVLQSDLSTGVVYRIGGDVPVNPIFKSGLTVNSGFTYSNGTEQFGYALLTDGTGYAYWGPLSSSTPSSGVTSITVGGGLSANSSTGAVTIIFTGSTGTSGAYLPLSGGTVTGGTIFTSGVTANTLSNVNYILFNKTATTTHTEGQIHWNDDTKTLEIDTDKTGVTYETGQNTLVRVTNKTGAPLTAGTVVYINGAQAGRPTVTKATYEQDATSARSLGFITQTINDNNQGYVTTNGLLRNVNTNSYSAGTQLYLYTGGTITNVRPVAPLHEVRLGYVVTQGSADGVIYVYIQNGYEFTELHDVQISGQTNNDIPYWNSVLGVWKNTNSPVFTSLTATTISAETYQNLPVSAVTSGTGISASTSNGVVTVTNTLPDQTVTISGGTGITTGGTYPNFSITNSDRGSSQNIFKNIQIAGITQFGANSNTSNLNFSGINISITSGANNTLIFSAGTGGGGGASIAIYDETDLLTSNVSSITFEGAGVTATNTGNNVTVTIPGGGSGGGTTLIASSSCNITPNGTIYIGNSTYGWNGVTWDLDDITFDATYSNCGVALTKRVTFGKLNICGIAYINDSTPTTCDFTIYIYKFSCGAVEGITSLVLLASQENKNAYDRMGVKCFTLEYVLPPGDILEDCSDFIVIGFQSTSNDATQVKISYSLSSN